MRNRDAAGTLYLKCVNLTGEDKEVRIALDGYAGKTALGTQLRGSLSAENTFEKTKILPETFRESVDETGFTHTFPAHSVVAFRIG